MTEKIRENLSMHSVFMQFMQLIIAQAVCDSSSSVSVSRVDQWVLKGSMRNCQYRVQVVHLCTLCGCCWQKH